MPFTKLTKLRVICRRLRRASDTILLSELGDISRNDTGLTVYVS